MKKYTILGECVPKARAKYNRYGGSYGKAFEQQKKYEQHVRDELKAQGFMTLDEPIFVVIVIHKGFLKSWTKAQTLMAEMGKVLPSKRPDIDNYTKSILDGANGLLFKDDAQIVGLYAEKRYSKVPRVELQILTIKEALKRREAFFGK